MKYLTTILLLLFPTSILAQSEDYRLFRDGVQYLYGDHEGYINFGIKLNGSCDSAYTYLANAYAPSVRSCPGFPRARRRAGTAF